MAAGPEREPGSGRGRGVAGRAATAPQQGGDRDRGGGDEPGGDEQGQVEPVGEGNVCLGGDGPAQAHTAFADGLHLALLIAAGLVAAAAIAVATLLRGRDRTASDTPAVA